MILREMLVDDLDQVMEIEQDLFHVPWTKDLPAENYIPKKRGKLTRLNRQKEGIGAFLMQSLIRLAAEREVTTIHLEVRVGNETAIRLYERMGFTGDGIRKAYYSDPVEDALLMTRHPE